MDVAGSYSRSGLFSSRFLLAVDLARPGLEPVVHPACVLGRGLVPQR